MADSTAGNVVVKISADVTQLRADMSRATQVVQGSMKTIEGAAELAKGALIGMATAFSANTLVSAFKTSIDRLADLDDAAKIAGTSIANISKAQQISAAYGHDFSQVTQGTAYMARLMADNTSTATHALKALGVSAKDGSGNLRDAGAVVNDVAMKLATYKDGAAKVALVSDLMGRSGANLLPYLADVAEHLKDVQGVSEKSVTSAHAWNDTVGEMKMHAQILAQNISVSMLPTLQGFVAIMRAAQTQTDSSTSSAHEFSLAGEAMGKIFETVAVLGANVSYVFKQVGAEIGGLAAQAAALAHGDFAGVASIHKMMQDDAIKARQDVDALSARILKAREYAQAIRDTKNNSNPMQAGGLQVLHYIPKTAAQAGAADAAALLKAQLAQRVQAIKDAQAAEQAAWSYYNAALRGAYDAGKIDLSTYNAAQVAAIQAATAQKTQALQQQIQAIQAAAARMPKAADRTTAQAQITALVQQQVQAQAQAQQQLILLGQQQAQSAEQAQQRLHALNAELLDLRGNAAAAARIRLQDSLANTTRAVSQDGGSVAMLSAYREAKTQQLQFQDLQRQQQQIYDDLSNREQYLAALQAQGAISGTEQLNQLHAYQQQRIVDLNAITNKLQDMAQASNNVDWVNQANSARVHLEQVRATLHPMAADIKSTLVDGFSNGFDSIITGTSSVSDAFSKMAANILASLAQIYAQKAATQLIDSIFGSFALAGARAAGGPVAGGSAYLVGERGPEIFTPGSSGTIVPNSALQGVGGGGAVTVQVNLETGATQTTASSADTAALGNMMANTCLQVIAQQKRAGGLLAKAG